MPFPNPDTQFRRGRSGNARGRPRGTTTAARLRELVEGAKLEGRPTEGGKRVADLLAEVILREALKGDARFMSMLLDRVEGKALARLELEEERPAPHAILDADPRFPADS